MRPEKKPSVVHILPKHSLGGAEVAALHAANHFENNAICLFIYFMTRSSLIKKPKNKRVVVDQHKSLWNPLAHFNLLIWLNRVEPDLLIASIWWTYPIAVIYKILHPKTKLILFFHNEQYKHFVEKIVTSFSSIVANKIWVDSKKTALATNRWWIKSLKVNTISFKLRSLPKVVKNKKKIYPNFIYWGRISKQKNILKSLHFINYLRRREIEANFDIYGASNDDNYLKSVKKYIQENKMEKFVHIHPPLSHIEIEKIVPGHYFYLMLSEYEGFSMSTSEAMQTGLVPIVPNVGEISNYCHDLKNSLIFKNGKDVEFNELIEKLSYLLSNESSYNNISNNATHTWINRPTYIESFTLNVLDFFKPSVDQS